LLQKIGKSLDLLLKTSNGLISTHKLIVLLLDDSISHLNLTLESSNLLVECSDLTFQVTHLICIVIHYSVQSLLGSLLLIGSCLLHSVIQFGLPLLDQGFPVLFCLSLESILTVEFLSQQLIVFLV
jgi:hypothetical protein